MITDAYTVQFLLEGTLANPPRVVWRESAPGLTAQTGGVSVDLSETCERAGARISVQFRKGEDVFALHEPLNQGWLSKRYATPDDEHLASLLGRLWQAASIQARRAEAPDEIRARLYRQMNGDRRILPGHR
jgi:hypothetical protein